MRELAGMKRHWRGGEGGRDVTKVKKKKGDFQGAPMRKKKRHRAKKLGCVGYPTRRRKIRIRERGREKVKTQKECNSLKKKNPVKQNIPGPLHKQRRGPRIFDYNGGKKKRGRDRKAWTSKEKKHAPENQAPAKQDGKGKKKKKNK